MFIITLKVLQRHLEWNVHNHVKSLSFDEQWSSTYILHSICPLCMPVCLIVETWHGRWISQLAGVVSEVSNPYNQWSTLNLGKNIAYLTVWLNRRWERNNVLFGKERMAMLGRAILKGCAIIEVKGQFFLMIKQCWHKWSASLSFWPLFFPKTVDLWSLIIVIALIVIIILIAIFLFSLVLH